MSSSQKDYYEILGISKEATPEEIRKAYKKLAIKWHPDKHVDDKKEAEEKFKEIAEAYSVLSDPDTKREYDTGGTDFDFPDFFNFDPFAMFESFFGKRHGLFRFDDDDEEEEEDDFFSKKFGIGKGFGFSDKIFGFKNDLNMGIGEGKSVKKTTQIINGKKIIKTETTTCDSKGNKKTVIKEETGDGKVREYLIGEDGQKIDMNLKQLKSGEQEDNKEYSHNNEKNEEEEEEDNNEEDEENQGRHHHHHHGHHGRHNHHHEDNNKKMTNKKRYIKKSDE